MGGGLPSSQERGCQPWAPSLRRSQARRPSLGGFQSNSKFNKIPMFVLHTGRSTKFFSKEHRCLYMIDPDKMSEAEGRDSNDTPLSIEF